MTVAIDMIKIERTLPKALVSPRKTSNNNDGNITHLSA